LPAARTSAVWGPRRPRHGSAGRDRGADAPPQVHRWPRRHMPGAQQPTAAAPRGGHDNRDEAQTKACRSSWRCANQRTRESHGNTAPRRFARWCIGHGPAAVSGRSPGGVASGASACGRRPPAPGWRGSPLPQRPQVIMPCRPITRDEKPRPTPEDLGPWCHELLGIEARVARQPVAVRERTAQRRAQLDRQVPSYGHRGRLGALSGPPSPWRAFLAGSTAMGTSEAPPSAGWR
jgi:hypothetical protein